VIEDGEIDSNDADFYSELYQKGLGEFFYVNKLDPATGVNFPVTKDNPLPPSGRKGDGFLVGIGGGKDSLVSADILKDSPGFSTWSVGHRNQLTPLIEKISPPEHFWVERTIDKKIIELNKQGAMNGHIPISAIFAAVGCVVAVL